MQFTYFQQAGGRPLAVPAVEITYGLERILMALQVCAAALSVLGFQGLIVLKPEASAPALWRFLHWNFGV